MDSPFDVLGVDPDADEGEIERAYRRRVKEAHPDHGGSPGEFQRVRTAYEEAIAESEPGTATERVDSDRAGSGSSDRAGRRRDPTGDEVHRAAETRVEYLNYEVLGDHGWALDDDDLFETAADAGLAAEDYGEFTVGPAEYLLEAAEDSGYAWPFACRGGACANCAVLVREGELAQPVDHILPEELLDRGIRLSCMGAPLTAELQVVFNLKHLPELDDLRLPPRPFEHAHAGD